MQTAKVDRQRLRHFRLAKFSRQMEISQLVFYFPLNVGARDELGRLQLERQRRRGNVIFGLLPPLYPMEEARQGGQTKRAEIIKLERRSTCYVIAL